MKEVDNEESFAFWLKSANPGESILYYSGFLMRDREVFMRGGGFADKFPPRIKAALAAWRAYLDGEATLTQRKRGNFDYDYIAIKS